MKKQLTNYSLLQNFAVAFFFAFALLFTTQNAYAQYSPPCAINPIPSQQQMNFGNNNKIVIGGYGANDGSICWNCYSDSLVYGRSRAFNMPTMGFVAGSPVPHWSSRIFQDIPKQILRIQNGQNWLCYDSIQWNRGIALDINGNVGIGTDLTYGYKLAVNGGIVAKNDIRATLLGVTWPDYVFAPTYQLKPLLLLEREIDSIGHLPELPSAQEVEQNGLSLPQISTQLVKKVEELTLYTIEQEKKIEELTAQTTQQDKKIEELKQLVDRLLKEKE